ncbi:DUF6498-containing protein [Halolamina pelagica]|uniref:DUF6498-containing protein n=1 Tax=Halolamina pelagica TaxID=699431 RepID=UPI0006CAA25B
MAADTPDRDAVAAVIASNLVAPAGVFLLGWSATVLFGVLAAEFTALVCWSLVKMPFAAMRPRGGAVDRSRVAGLLHRLRGSISLPGPLPPVYPRNAMPLLGGVVFGTIGVVIALAVVGAVASEGLADGEATAIGLGFVVVFLFRAAETVVEYFLHGGYREHSARSAFFEPVVAAFGLAVLLVAALTLEAAGLGDTVRAAETLAVLAVGKAALDVRGLRIEADDDRYGVLARMFGAKRSRSIPSPSTSPTPNRFAACDPPEPRRSSTPRAADSPTSSRAARRGSASCSPSSRDWSAASALESRSGRWSCSRSRWHGRWPAI